jgi:hypothetical protein
MESTAIMSTNMMDMIMMINTLIPNPIEEKRSSKRL